jgi:hypothetical protein
LAAFPAVSGAVATDGPFGRLATAGAIAAVPTVVFLVPTIAGISSWKWILAVLAVRLLVTAERQTPARADARAASQTDA